MKPPKNIQVIQMFFNKEGRKSETLIEICGRKEKRRLTGHSEDLNENQHRDDEPFVVGERCKIA
jgi:hypothetical protein